MAKPLDFPSSFPSRLVLGLVLFPVVTVLAYVTWYAVLLTPLERQYLGPYLSSAVLEGKAVKATFRPILLTGPGHRTALAHDADVVGLSPFSNPIMPLELSPAARAVGWTGLTWSDKRLYPPAALALLLQDEFFAGKSLAMVFLPLAIGLVLLLFLTDRLCNRVGVRSGYEDRHGRRTKGPELRTPASLKRSTKTDGIRLRLVASRFDRRGRSFAIPKKLESSHILLMGDTGSGKSNVIRQILHQVSERGESAIVYDPAGEFVQEFYRPDRGDLILNPLDERCPFWNLGGEISGHGTAAAIAAALLPEKESEKGFFVDAPRRVLARLLSFKPTVEELLRWMADPAEIEQRLAGTPQAAYLDKAAGPQRAGVLSSLNMIADSLALLPGDDGKRQRFATEQWGSVRTRWVFLSSRPSLRDRILPLHSVWLDLLILRMMEPCANPAKPVWFVLDELASLNNLPQLHTALTENRKYGNPVVLGFQGRSQLEKRYGQDAESMLSQPATKIFFKTSEPRAAKWISDSLGEIEVERLKESRTPEGFGTKQSHAMEIATKPLVMPSEIAGLEPLKAYIKQENQVVPVQFALVQKTANQPEFVERKMVVPATQPVLAPAQPAPLQAKAASLPPPQTAVSVTVPAQPALPKAAAPKFVPNLLASAKQTPPTLVPLQPTLATSIALARSSPDTTLQVTSPLNLLAAIIPVPPPHSVPSINAVDGKQEALSQQSSEWDESQWID